MTARVAIVILHWNNYPDTAACLGSLAAVAAPPFAMIVVDNGSEAAIVRRLRDDYPGNEFLLMPRNEGFARAMNAGFRRAIELGFPLILSLNNDTVVTPGFLAELVKTADEHPEAGIFAPKLLNFRDRSRIDSAGHVFRWGTIIDRGHGRVDRGQFDRKTDVVGGCAAGVLYRSEMLRQVGLFEESLGTQYEDAELSWRAMKAGWKAVFVPDSVVYHKRGGTKNRDQGLRFELEVLANVRNVARTVRRYGRPVDKVLYKAGLAKQSLAYFLKGQPRVAGAYFRALAGRD
ncbi:MAG: glycosyltransferase family 2 protein [Candidatus Aminicenantes bacterium]|nr:glycosyltransferase family 2 protein [Candidatus Aminicenantes bacterium]